MKVAEFFRSYKYYGAICLGIMFSLQLQAQVIGGNSVYDFVNHPVSARAMATGGNLITVYDDDASLAYHNPALLNKSMRNMLVASTVIDFAGINHGYFGYTNHYSNLETNFQAGLQYITYGSFTMTDVTGAELGNFNAGEFAINIGASHQFDRYSFGGNYKLIYSKLESYTSIGNAIDLAAAYSDSSGSFTATLLLKNIGFQFKPYHAKSREPIPFEIQAGFSKRLKYVPFRISVVLHDLQKWNIRYDDPNSFNTDNVFLGDSTNSDGKGKKAGDFFDNVGRHLILGGELYLGKALRVGFGYNHQRRAELKPDVKKGLAGFSFGVGIDIKQFSFNFARARYHAKAATTQFTVLVNIDQFKNRTRKPKNSSAPEPTAP